MNFTSLVESILLYSSLVDIVRVHVVVEVNTGLHTVQWLTLGASNFRVNGSHLVLAE